MSATRKPGRNFLFVPGPTNIPDRILRAMHIAMEDHRSSDFPKLTLPLYERLKRIFKTKEGQVVIFPSSGTGAWEAALTNTLASGNKVLIARFGQFSHLWGELAKRHGLDVIVQDEEWGTGANPWLKKSYPDEDRCWKRPCSRAARGRPAHAFTQEPGPIPPAHPVNAPVAKWRVSGGFNYLVLKMKTTRWQAAQSIQAPQRSSAQ